MASFSKDLLQVSHLARLKVFPEAWYVKKEELLLLHGCISQGCLVAGICLSRMHPALKLDSGLLHIAELSPQARCLLTPLCLSLFSARFTITHQMTGPAWSSLSVRTEWQYHPPLTL